MITLCAVQRKSAPLPSGRNFNGRQAEGGDHKKPSTLQSSSFCWRTTFTDGFFDGRQNDTLRTFRIEGGSGVKGFRVEVGRKKFLYLERTRAQKVFFGKKFSSGEHLRIFPQFREISLKLAPKFRMRISHRLVATFSKQV